MIVMEKVTEISSFKEFSQKDIYNFLKFRGTELYSEKSGSDLPNHSFSNSLRRGNFRLPTILDVISSESIIFPANKKVYKSKEYIEAGKEGSLRIEPNLDIKVLCNNGFLEFEEGDCYSPMYFILPKYHTKNSSWHYKIVRIDNGNPKLILTVPTNPEDWKEIIKVFTEFAVLLKLFTGCYFKVCILGSTYTPSYQKLFSINEGITFIPTIINLGYKYVGYPKLMGVVSKRLNELSVKEIRPGVKNKLISYAKQNYKDLYIVNLFTGSCYINPQYIKDVDSLRNEGDSKRLRTPMDWILKAYEDKKHIIFYSDLDNPIAIAHELGHYLEDKDGTYGKIQRNNKSGLLNKDNTEILAYFAGFLGQSSGDLLEV